MNEPGYIEILVTKHRNDQLLACGEGFFGKAFRQKSKLSSFNLMHFSLILVQRSALSRSVSFSYFLPDLTNLRWVSLLCRISSLFY